MKADHNTNFVYFSSLIKERADPKDFLQELAMVEGALNCATWNVKSDRQTANMISRNQQD